MVRPNQTWTECKILKARHASLISCPGWHMLEPQIVCRFYMQQHPLGRTQWWRDVESECDDHIASTEDISHPPWVLRGLSLFHHRTADLELYLLRRLINKHLQLPSWNPQILSGWCTDLTCDSWWITWATWLWPHKVAIKPQTGAKCKYVVCVNMC